METEFRLQVRQKLTEGAGYWGPKVCFYNLGIYWTT